MNQRELFRRIAEKTGTSASNVELIVEAMTTTIQDVLLEGDKVSITRFGTFKLKKKKGRKAYDPYHSEIIHIPSRSHVTFEANKSLRNKLIQLNND